MKNVIKKSRIILVIMLGSLFHITQVGAQNHRSHEPPPSLPDSSEVAKMMEKMSGDLSLSNSQKTSISKLYYAHFKEAKARQEGHGRGRARMESLRKEFEDKVKAELNGEQRAEFAQFNKNRRLSGKGKQRPKH